MYPTYSYMQQYFILYFNKRKKKYLHQIVLIVSVSVANPPLLLTAHGLLTPTPKSVQMQSMPLPVFHLTA